MKPREVWQTVAAAAAGGVVYGLLVRPWMLRWGATREEIARDLPGDDIIPDAELQSTRAITIDAPSALVWQALEDTIDESSHLITAGPYGGSGQLVFRHYEPGVAMVLGSAENAPGARLACSFVVEPLDAATTRVLVRSRGAGGSAGAKAANLGFWEPAQFLIERKLLGDIKNNAERRTLPAAPMPSPVSSGE